MANRTQEVNLFITHTTKGKEFISRLCFRGFHLTIPNEIIVTKHIFEIPYELPFFSLSFAGEESQVDDFIQYLRFLRGGSRTNNRKCSARIDLSLFQLFILPPETSVDRKTILKCGYRLTGRATVVAEPSSLPGSVHPRFLKTSSQNHEGWMFGGFAELIHNSSDAKARELKIDYDESLQALHFIDNGQGMTHDELVNMLCFGHEEELDPSQERIGKFGVGFKTGTMRICNDAIIFTRCKETQSIGLLSQTLNEKNKQLIVPIVTWKLSNLEYDQSASSFQYVTDYMDAIKRVSPYKNDFIIQEQFRRIKASGTRVILFNLRMKDLDFSEKEDIQLQDRNGKRFVRRRNGSIASDVPLDYSLRAYCEVMFLRPKMLISIRGVRVRTRLMKESLRNVVSEKNEELECSLVIGYSSEAYSKGLAGLMMYWRNILIKAYHRLGIQLHNSDAALGIIGIVECNALDPLNNKQDFQELDKFANTEDWLKEKVDLYWNAKELEKDSKREPLLRGRETELEWVQCNKCLKWRKLLAGITAASLPAYWFCLNNPDPNYNSCQYPQEDFSDWGTIQYSLTDKSSTPKKKTLTSPPSSPSLSLPSSPTHSPLLPSASHHKNIIRLERPSTSPPAKKLKTAKGKKPGSAEPVQPVQPAQPVQLDLLVDSPLRARFSESPTLTPPRERAGDLDEDGWMEEETVIEPDPPKPQKRTDKKKSRPKSSAIKSAPAKPTSAKPTKYSIPEPEAMSTRSGIKRRKNQVITDD